VNKIVVTGGAGFIGQTLIGKLIADTRASLVVIDNFSPQIHGTSPSLAKVFSSSRVTVIRQDISEEGEWLKQLSDANALVHLAAETGTGQSMYEIAKYTQVNIAGTALILDWLANNKNQISNLVLASSRSVYGEGLYSCNQCREYLTPEPRANEQLSEGKYEQFCASCGTQLRPIGTPETSPLKPASIYAATKQSQETLFDIFARSSKMKANILRFQNVYGEGQSLKNPYTGILSIWANLMRQNLDVSIFEDGLESRDFIHVTDVVNAIYLSLTKSKYGVNYYNVGSGAQTTVSRIGHLLKEYLNSNSKLVVTGEYRIGDIRHNYADLTNIEEELGFSPEINLEQGLQLFCDWVLKNEIETSTIERANAELKNRNLMGISHEFDNTIKT
jgi:dTDP-L-rhamnose 4-epimerase